MKNLQFHYYMDIEFSEPVYNHTYTLRCIPKTTDTQEIAECTANICPENKVQRGMTHTSKFPMDGIIRTARSTGVSLRDSHGRNSGFS